MKFKASGLDVALIALCAFDAAAASLWWLAPIPVIVGMCFVNPRWDKQNGWRFKHGD